MFFKRFKRGELKLNRIEAFSDGVFAIIVTLLVLDLKVPELHNGLDFKELAAQLCALTPKFLSWLISFIIVCKFWLNHNHLLGQAKHANYALVWLNSIFLMFQSFIPFPTALMGEYPNNPLAISAFGIVMAFNTLLFIILQTYIIRNLLKPELSKFQDKNLVLKSFIGVASYSLGVLAAWYNVYAAFAIYALTPLLFIVPPAQKRK